MKDLSPFIRDLLYGNDCVILPGFGGFIGNYTPARINRENDTFYPPVKAISFNSKLNHNDGLLIGRISEKRGLGYVDSKRIVEDFIGGLKDKLSGGERVHMEGIGHFRYNSEGSLQFEPDNNINFLLDSYGLTGFTREPVRDYDVSRVITGRFDRDPAVTASRRKMIWRAAVAVPFIAAMIVIPVKTDMFRSGASLNPLARVELAEAVSAGEEQSGEMTDGTVSEVKDIANTENKPVEDKTTVTDENTAVNNAGEAGTYYLIIGSFKDQENAEHLYNKIAEEGHNAGLIKADNGYFRVSIESFGTSREAIDERSRLNDTFPGIWICKK